MMVRQSGMTRSWLRPVLALAVCALPVGGGTRTTAQSTDHTTAAAPATPQAVARAEPTSSWPTSRHRRRHDEAVTRAEPLPESADEPGSDWPASPDLVTLTQVMLLSARSAGATIPDSVTRIALVATPGDQLGPGIRRVVAGFSGAPCRAAS